MSDFSYDVELAVRYRDLDTMGHVNNAVYATYLEQARTSYIEDIVGREIGEIGLALANLEIDFNHELTFREHVTVALRTTKVGESSVTMEYEIRAGDTVAASASSVTVTVDDDGSPCQIPAEIRESIIAHEEL